LQENVMPKAEANETKLSAEIRELDLTFFHEAGHAVAGYLTGRRVHEIAILEDGKNWGMCRYASPRWTPRVVTERWRREVIIRALAGPVAECIREGHTTETLAEFEARRPEMAKRATGDDYQSDIAAARAAASPWGWDVAPDFAVMCDAHEEAAYLDWMWVRTRSMLTRYWPAVEALVGELQWVEEPIPGRRAHKIIREAMSKAVVAQDVIQD
jgi:hypothetical protein